RHRGGNLVGTGRAGRHLSGGNSVSIGAGQGGTGRWTLGHRVHLRSRRTGRCGGHHRARELADLSESEIALHCLEWARRDRFTAASVQSVLWPSILRTNVLEQAGKASEPL